MRCWTRRARPEFPRCARNSASARAGMAVTARRRFGAFLRRALENDAPARRSALGPEVDDPVGLGDHVQVVLDHDHRVARIHQPVQHADQLLHVGHVQADGRFVEHVERFTLRAGLGQFGNQLQALRLAARERRALLAQGQVAQADVLHQAQRAVRGGMRGEERRRLVHAHRQHFADGLFAPAHRQRLRVEALAAAGLAGDLHVGQEGHFDLLDALALAVLAAPALGVEGEAARAPAAHARLGRVGEAAADRVPEADVGGRAGARRLADRRLVHFQHPVEQFRAGDCLAADGFLIPSRKKTRHPGRASICPSPRRR